MATRYDIIDAELNDLKPAHRTPEGYLMVEGTVTRTGVFAYTRADGTKQWEARLLEDVTDDASLESLAGKPIVLLHPREDGTPVDVTPDNVAQYQVGTMGTELKVLANGHVRAQLLIHRRDAIDAIERDGIRQLSPGYAVREDATPGEYEGRRYDLAQRDIRYNHLAIVPRGRQGEAVSFRLDADDAVQAPNHQPAEPANNRQGCSMHKVRIDGIEVEVADAATVKLIESREKRIDELEAGNTTLAEQLAAEKTRADEAEGKAAALEANVRTDEQIEAERIAWAKERAELTSAAQRLSVKLDDADAELGNADLRRKIVASKLDSLAEDASDDTVSGALAALLTQAPSKSRVDGAFVPPADGQPSNGATGSRLDAAQAAYEQHLINASRSGSAA